jgi:LAT3 family solute carrier family 43 protein 3
VTSVAWGAILVGFQGLLPILNHEEQYHELCATTFNTTDFNTTTSGSNVCPEQSVRMQLMFIVAVTVANMSNLVVGPIVDILGPRTLGFISSITGLIAMILLALSNSKTFDAFIPGYTIMGLSGVLCIMATMSVANLFPYRMRTFLQALFMASQDTASLVFFIMQKLYFSDSVKLSRRNIMLMYMIIPALLGLYSFFLPGKNFVPEELTPSTEECAELIKGEENQKWSLKPALASWWKEAKSQLFTPQYLVLQIWIAILMTTSYGYLGTLRDQLIWLSNGDMSYVDTASNWFNIMMFFVAVISVPAVAIVVDFFGPISYVGIVGAMYVIYGVCSVIRNYNLQYFTFVTFIMGRAHLYGALLTFVTSYFTTAFGTVMGFSTFVASLANLTNYLWAYLAVDLARRQFLWYNIGMLIASVIAIVIMMSYLGYKKIKTYNKHVELF